MILRRVRNDSNHEFLPVQGPRRHGEGLRGGQTVDVIIIIILEAFDIDVDDERRRQEEEGGRDFERRRCRSDILFLKHDSSIFRQSSNPVCGFSMMEQVRLCCVWPTEN